MSAAVETIALAAALILALSAIGAIVNAIRNRAPAHPVPFTIHAAGHWGFRPAQWATLTPEQQHHYAKDQK